MSYYIKHKTQNWTACIHYSMERAEKWLNEFNPQKYMDKTLKSTDFRIEAKNDTN